MRFTVMETIYPQLWALIIVVSMVSGTAVDYTDNHISDTERFHHSRNRPIFKPNALAPIMSSPLFDPEPTVPTLPTIPPVTRPINCPVQRNSIKLNFSNMSMGRFDNGVIDYRDVISLNLSRNFIEHVPADAFIHLALLEELDLSVNRIPVDNLLRFKNLPRLVSLYVDDNSNKKTEKGGVLSQTDDARLPYLKTLSLSGNRITDFTVSLKDFSPRLTHLFLSRNKIGSSEFLNDVPPTLTHLVLDDNTINRIENGKLDYLLELSMNRNKLEVVCIHQCSAYSLQLQGMRGLKILRLAGNNIKRIELGYSSSSNSYLSNLHTLDLSFNHLTEIPNEIAGEFHTVKYLFLGYNRISEIPKICNLRSLHTLDLSGNRIKIVPAESFCNLILVELNLSYNQITTIHTSAFNIGVRTLDLSGNHLSKLSFPWITHPGHAHILRLENNSIANFDDVDLTGMNNLRELYITRNPLTHIVMNSFIRLLSNLHIYFHDEKDCILGNVEQDDDDDKSDGW